MKIAIVYDRVNKFGGAEQVLLALHTLWPDAPLYTAVYNPATAAWANIFQVIPSFLNSFPFASTHHELYPWATPFAFESFSFDAYDVVISVTSAEAKYIITKPDTIHICYCLTPTRYLWSGENTYQTRSGMGSLTIPAVIGLKMLQTRLKQWDRIASARPDYYIAISEHVKHRIEHYYHRPVSAVIYPPVNTALFSKPPVAPKTVKPSFLTVARLVGYKRLDLLVDTFSALRLPLTIIGDGKDRGFLERRAKKNIRLITKKLTEQELAEYYHESTAFVFAGQEDFGIVAAEALACGVPVLCYADSGMAEIVVPGKTGEVFSEQTVSCLTQAVRSFNPERYSGSDCRERALKFDTMVFQKQMRQFIEKHV